MEVNRKGTATVTGRTTNASLKKKKEANMEAPPIKTSFQCD